MPREKKPEHMKEAVLTADQISAINFKKQGDLIPVVVQDAVTRTVLMVGFMNLEALEKTLSSGFVTFFSVICWSKKVSNSETLARE